MCICAAIYLFALLNNNNGQEMLPDELTAETIDEAPEETPQAVPQSIVVDVKGAVKKPGVYEMKAGDRVHQAIREAGGVLDGAEQNQLNLAQLLQDGMVIFVPEKGEEMAPSGAASAGQSTNAGSTGQNDSSTMVNINTATAEELQTLPGIGPSKAETIIAYREENGGFQTIEDMMNVSGIGEKSFEKLKSSITVK